MRELRLYQPHYIFLKLGEHEENAWLVALVDFKVFASLILVVLSHKRSEQYRQANLTGITGFVRFDEDGKRTGVDLEILNLRNNSFKTVSTG